MYVISLFLIVGIYILIFDCDILKKKKLDREYKMAKLIGISYVLVAFGYFIYYINRR